MRHPESIQELLADLGWIASQDKRAFIKAGLEIPFEAVAKHNVGSFIELARARGWITDDEIRVIPLQ